MDEPRFQDLVERYPKLLPGAQITSESPRRWMLISREVAVPKEEGGYGLGFSIICSWTKMESHIQLEPLAVLLNEGNVMQHDHKRIRQAIAEYATGYLKLDEIQNDQDQNYLPIGDQKTGVVGEYYAKIYLERKYQAYEVSIGSTSQDGWDLKVIRPGGDAIKYQVKTVSEYSRTRRISPIHKGWDFLLLVFLGRDLYPRGMWEVEHSSDFRVTVRNKVMPKPNTADSGSKVFSRKVDVMVHFESADAENVTIPGITL